MNGDATMSQEGAFDGGSTDLDLQAVRYIGGEMASAEAAAFEGLLAQDQSARDAVEFAVRVAMGVGQVGTPVHEFAIPSRENRTWRRVAAAATVLLALGLCTYIWGLDSGESADGEPTPAQAESLISSWVAFGDLDEVTAEEEYEGEEDDGEEFAGFDAGVAPDWMIQGLK